MGDFARKTAHLSMIEKGAYNTLLDHYYSTARSLPPDNDSLYRIAGAHGAAERKAVEKVADEFFPVNGDGTRHNKRADEEIEKHGKQVAINRELGKKGGRPRKTESLTESVSEKEPNRKPIREPNRNPSQIPEVKPKSKEAASPRGIWDEARTVLTESGLSLETSRSWVSKCLKDWPEDTVKDAILEARGTNDPKSYAMRILQGKPKKNGRESDYTRGAV